MISSRGIFSTGEKKCSPMNRSGCADALARSVMGSAEVLEAQMLSSAMSGSTSFVTRCFARPGGRPGS